MTPFEKSLESLADEMLQSPSAPTPAPKNGSSGKVPAERPRPTIATGKETLTRSEAPADPQPADGNAAVDETPDTPDREEPVIQPDSVDTDDGRVNPRLVCLLEPRSEHAESYYRLRYKLETRRRPDSALVVGVTSPNPGDGKTLTGINLAGALAKGADSRVLLLDLDLRRNGDGVSEYLAMKSSKEQGVVDWIHEKDYGYEQYTHYLHRFNLHVMTAGSNPELPYELLKSPRLDELLRRARRDYDFVIIDTPQILSLPDTELISRLVDGFLIVVKADRTRQEKLEEALNLMTEDKVIGLVFNAVTENG